MLAGAGRHGVSRVNVVTAGRAGRLAAPRKRPASARPGEPVAAGEARRLAAALSKGMALVAEPPQVPAVVIALPAEIDKASAGRAGQQRGSAIAPGVRTVIAGMTATRFVTDRASACWCGPTSRRPRTEPGCGWWPPPRAVWRAVTLAALDQLLAIYPGLSQALAARPAPRPEPRHKPSWTAQPAQSTA
jgi:hypothetical protein